MILEFKINKQPTAIKSKNLLKTITASVFLFGLIFASIMQSISPALAVSQKDIDLLQQKLNQAKQKINSINQEQTNIVNTINEESKNISNLDSETKQLDLQIHQSELQIKSLELEIDKLQIETDIATNEKNALDQKLVDLAAELKRLHQELLYSSNLLYKISVSEQIVADKNQFANSMMKREKSRAIINIIQTNVETTKKVEKEVSDKKAEVAQKEQSLKDLTAQKIAQNDNLNLQKQGIAFQKDNKLALIEQAKSKKIELAQRNNQLETTEKLLNNEVGSYETKIVELKTALFAKPAPKTGATITNGQVIGFQGRTGLSCNPLEPGVKITNNFCQVYGSTGPGWYYYDPIKYPSKGSHLHFMYMNAKGQKNLTYQYLFDPRYRSEFVRMPMDWMSLGRGYHEDFAIDLVSTHGAPVYAVKPGRVEYYCIKYPNVAAFTDPAYGAIVYHYDGSKSQYWHLQRRPNSPPCTFLY